MKKLFLSLLLVALFSLALVSAANLTTGLYGAFTFDDDLTNQEGSMPDFTELYYAARNGTDQSGTANGAVWFDGMDKSYIKTAATGTGSASMTFVMTIKLEDNGKVSPYILHFAEDGSNEFHTHWYDAGGDAVAQRARISGSGTTYTATGSGITNDWITLIHTVESGNHSLYINGTYSAGGTASQHAGGYTNVETFLGTANSNISDYSIRGLIGEFYVYNRQLNKTEIENISGGCYYPFTGAACGGAAPTPSTTPFTITANDTNGAINSFSAVLYNTGVTPPIYWSFGDSITAGHTLFDPQASYYAGSDPVENQFQYWFDVASGANSSLQNATEDSYYNRGRGGQTCDQINARLNTIPASRTNDWIIYGCGANDMYYNVVNDTTEIIADYEEAYTNLSGRVAGILAWTIIPYDYVGQGRSADCAEAKLINNWLRTNFSLREDVYLADLAILMNSSSDECIRNTALYTDYGHPNQDGYEVMGNGLWDAIDHLNFTGNNSYYSTTNGTIITEFINQDATYTIDVSASGHATATYTSYNISANLSAYLDLYNTFQITATSNYDASSINSFGAILYGPANLYDDQVAEYLFNWTTADTSKNQVNGTLNGYTLNNGTIDGATTGVTGKYGEGVSFNGIDDKINITSTTYDLLSGTTFSFWAKTPTDGNYHILDNNAGNTERITFLSGGRLYFESNTNGDDCGGDYGIWNNDWHHYTIIVENYTCYMYRDGSSFSTSLYGTTLTNNVTLQYLGGGSNNFNGTLDEVRIWDSALTESEVQAEMTSTYPIIKPIASYSFEAYNTTHVFDTNWNTQGTDNSTGAISFDGVDDKLTISSGSVLFSGDKTVCAWVKSNTLCTGGDEVAFSWVANSSWRTGIVCRDGEIGATVWDGTNYGDGFINVVADEWNHICYIDDGITRTSLEVYANGVIAPNASSAGLTSTAGVFIGSESASREFNGSVSDLRIFDKALSEDEITAIYNGSLFSGTGYTYEYSTTNGTIITNINTESGYDYNITIVNASNHWNESTLNRNTSTNMIATLDQYPLINIYNLWDSSQLSSYSVEIDSTNYTTTGTNVYVPFNTSKTGKVYKTNYIPLSGTENFTANSLTNISIYQSVITFNASELLTGDTLTSVTYSTNGTAGATIYPNAGTYNVTATKSGYYDNWESFTVTALDQKNIEVDDFYNWQLNVFVRTHNNATITNNSLLYVDGILVNSTFDSVNGLLSYSLVDGSYNVSVLPDGFAFYNFTVVNGSIPFNGSFYSYHYTNNSVQLYFYDEESLDLINGSVSIGFISDSISYNYSTSNGSLFVDSMFPADYNIRYSSSGYGERTYFFSLADNTYTSLDLYLANSSGLTTVTVNIYDTLQNPLSGARVSILRYNPLNNSYLLVAIKEANFAGKFEELFAIGSEYYKFIVEYDDDIVLTTAPSYIYTTEISLYANLLTSGFDELFRLVGLFGSISVTGDTAAFTWSDGDGVASGGCLYAYLSSDAGLTYDSEVCGSGASNTIYLTVTNSSGFTYLLKGYVTKNGDSIYLTNYWLSFGDEFSTGRGGLILAFILLGTFIFVGFWRLEVAVVFGGFGLLILSVSKIVALPIPYAIGMFLLAITAAFIIGNKKGGP